MKTLLATALFACLSASPPADAAPLEGALKDFKAILFDYFRNQPDPVIPIFLPAGEKPGDVYRDVFGGYVARQAECFNNVSVDKEESRFQEAVESVAGNLSGNVQAQFTEAARVGGGVGVKMGDSVTIRFRDVSAHVASDVALMTAFKKNLRACAAIGKLMRQPGSGNAALVLGQVFTAKQTIETIATVEHSGQLGGEVRLDEVMKKLGVLRDVLGAAGISLDVLGTAKIDGGRTATTQVSLTDPRPLPVGYRPAFLSQQHLNKLLELRQKGVLAEIERTVAVTRDTHEIEKKYNNVIFDPKRLAFEMASGDMIPFDNKNAEHVQYIQGLGLLFAIGIDAQSGSPRPAYTAPPSRIEDDGARAVLSERKGPPAP
ncbi:hypothetical protein [Pseudomonas sp. NMI760_13]|uniref:hypothetical protein n=1 Tax=Pseudomonas sp. NMI760_13 TaxID=2903147 RepID=UPI001E3988F0|nr:hypothetical protein [Pseudomonas sp. NMI760_13]MCE0915665.1 hypothetical protein [Pseudomonas sp. NMI760_13]